MIHCGGHPLREVSERGTMMTRRTWGASRPGVGAPRSIPSRWVPRRGHRGPEPGKPESGGAVGSALPLSEPFPSGVRVRMGWGAPYWQPLDGERGGRIGLVSPDAGGLCPEADGGSSPPYRGANPSTSDAGGWGRRAVVSVTSGVSGRGGARPNFLQKFGIDACQSGTFC